MEDPKPLSDVAKTTEEERSQRIAQLEARLAKPPGVGVMPPVAVLVMVIAGYLLWLQKPEIDYFNSSREPIDLGTEGAYRFDLALSNRYVQLHGVPTVRGAYGAEANTTFVVIGVKDTPVIVKRPTLPGENWKPGEIPPQPNQQPFTVRGRLLARADAPKLQDPFLKMETFGEVKPKWILIQGAVPGQDLGAMAFTGLLLAVVVLNLWLFVRGVIAMVRSRLPSAAR